MRLFRQKKEGDWRAPVTEILRELENFPAT
jgi:hypothetical protein